MLAGGCLCGAVRYVAGAAPLRSYLCHCRDCQRASGGPFAAAMLFAPGVLRLEGALESFDSTGESGAVIRRHFCPGCGGRVVNSGVPDEGYRVVLAGTLDDFDAFAPEDEIFCASAWPWIAPAGPRRQRGW